MHCQDSLTDVPTWETARPMAAEPFKDMSAALILELLIPWRTSEVSRAVLVPEGFGRLSVHHESSNLLFDARHKVLVDQEFTSMNEHKASTILCGISNSYHTISRAGKIRNDCGRQPSMIFIIRSVNGFTISVWKLSNLGGMALWQLDEMVSCIAIESG